MYFCLANSMIKTRHTTLFFAISILVMLSSVYCPAWAVADEKEATNEKLKEYTGSQPCRQCHEKFYKLWSTSHHGLAMQPYTSELAKEFKTQKNKLTIGNASYLAHTGVDQGWITETGPNGEKKYKIVHVMGGKNVYYLLTPMDKGRLQVLPLAYDVRDEKWFSTSGSGVRHFPGHSTSEEIDWRDPEYTFNTSCYGCHVSQLSRNYDIETKTYNTKWAEPGINCETCHGPAHEHVKMFTEGLDGETPKSLGLISTKDLSREQLNSQCLSCHAKQVSISESFKPGDRYFDHFGLVTFEHSDYYPDGRDLGENYTLTSWTMSKCVQSSKMDCIHCHTSSGRYRFKDPAIANDACLPCHQKRVENAVKHTRHAADSQGNKCISCHMPMTGFARMNRSDHSMRPPAPAATIEFQSPNACNNCHKDKDAKWADGHVRKWHRNDYQAPVIRLGRLVDQARKQDWSNLSDILKYLGSKDHDEVFTASLIRLLVGCDSLEKWPVLNKLASGDSSVIVRSAAVEAIAHNYTKDSVEALTAALTDDYRVVRIRAAEGLAQIPETYFTPEKRSALSKASDEFLKAMLAHTDDYLSHYNLGNFYVNKKDYAKAISSFTISHDLRPNSILPLNNIAFAYNATGQNEKAVQSFKKILTLEPTNSVASLNLGMLYGEMGQIEEAETAFRKTYESDPNSARAAYNLGIILAEKKPKESLSWCNKAFRLQPDNPDYGYTYAFFLNSSGDKGNAIAIIESMIERRLPSVSAYMLLADIYRRDGDQIKAKDVYRLAAENTALSEVERARFKQLLQN